MGVSESREMPEISCNSILHIVTDGFLFSVREGQVVCRPSQSIATCLQLAGDF